MKITLKYSDEEKTRDRLVKLNAHWAPRKAILYFTAITLPIAAAVES